MLRSFWYLAVAALAVGCSLESPDRSQSHLTIQIDNPASGAPESLFGTLMSVAPPADITGFTCLGVNVVGPGIVPQGMNTGEYSNLTGLLAGTSYCSYRGITSEAIPNTVGSHTVHLTVPAGPSRVIQMVGIADPQGLQCNQTGPLGGQDQHGQVGFYEIGRVITNLFSSQSVSIPDTFDTLSAAEQSKRSLDCGNSSYFNLVRGEAELLAYWPLVDSGSVTANNLSSSGAFPVLNYTGSYTIGGTGPLQGSANQNSNYAVTLGTGAEVQNNVNYVFSAGTNFSVEAWVKLPSGIDCSTGGGIAHFEVTGPYNKISLNCTGSTPALAHFQVIDVSTSVFAENQTIGINDGSWHYVVGTWVVAPGGVGTVRVYVDGHLGNIVNTAPLGQINITSGSFHVGGMALSALPGGAQVAHVAVYSNALTQPQIDSHYARALSP